MTRFAAIDVGTNTVRLLVVELSEAGHREVIRDQDITRLGRTVDAGRRLDPDAARGTLAAIERFVQRAREVGAGTIRIAGTSALRDAEDDADFLRRVREQTGCELEVIDGEREGALTFLGATSGLAPALRVVCDIGGGSTEFVRGTDRAEAVRSVDVGSVRLRERCLPSDPPRLEEIRRALELVDAELEEIEQALSPAAADELIGVAGTVTTVAALVLGLQRYDREHVHLARLELEDVAEWSERLLVMPVEEVRALPVMQSGRADVICAGALILRRLMERWEFGSVVVSERDILDGLVLDAFE